jgi:hypothetical protein
VKSEKPLLAFIMGPTNAGKSTLIQATKDYYPQFGTVEVGKLMRAKYPPEFFQGQAAPKHTAVEAWQMMLDGIADAGAKKAVLIDGQPRDIEQCERSILLPYPKLYIVLTASAEVREFRARARDSADPKRLELALARLHGDLPILNSIVSMLRDYGKQVREFSTESHNYQPLDVLRLIETFTAPGSSEGQAAARG